MQNSTNMLVDRFVQPEVNESEFMIPYTLRECYTLLQHIYIRMTRATGNMESACTRLHNAFSGGVDTTIENALLWFERTIIDNIIMNEPYFVQFKITKILVEKSIRENKPAFEHINSKLPIGEPNGLTENIQNYLNNDIRTHYEKTDAWTTMMRYKRNTPLTLSDLKQFLRFLEIKDSSKKTVVSSRSRDNIRDEHYPPGFIPEIFYPDDSHKKEENTQLRSRSRSRSRDKLPPIPDELLSEKGQRLIKKSREKYSRKPHNFGGKKTKKRRPKNK
jgi:hypothetical protein